MDKKPLPTTILVVEDAPATRRLLTCQLEGAGYRIRAVPDGPSALAMAARELPD